MLISLSAFPRRGRNKTGSRTAPKSYLMDAQWLLIADLFPYRRTTARGGRPPQPPRPCLEGILWVLVSGARWKDLPERDPSPSTCWRRLNEWAACGVFQEAWTRLLSRMEHLKGINWEEGIADGTFASAKKGAPRSARPSGAKAPRSCC